MIALLLLLAQPPAPAPSADLLVSLKVLQLAAEEFRNTPVCFQAPELPAPICQPALTAADLQFVREQVKGATTAIKQATTLDAQRRYARSVMTRIAQHLGSSGYQRLFPYVNAATIVIGPVEPLRRLDKDGRIIPDDQ